MRIDDIRWNLSADVNWEVINEEVLAWANIGRAYWDVSLDRIGDHLDYKRVIRHYVRHMHDQFEPYGTGLFLHGPFGSGKTSLACYVLRYCLARGGRSFFIRAQDLIRSVESFNTIYVREGVPIEEMAKKVTMLAIDDVDLLDPKLKHVETIMRWRDDNDLTTIVTSNLAANEKKSTQERSLGDWVRSVAAQRLIGVQIVGPSDGGYDWRRDPPQE